jgi:hypothetical protein
MAIPNVQEKIPTFNKKSACLTKNGKNAFRDNVSLTNSVNIKGVLHDAFNKRTFKILDIESVHETLGRTDDMFLL